MKPRKKIKSFALALRLRARAATLLIALLCGVTGAWAQSTASVSTYAELSTAIGNASVTTIIVTADIDVPCGTSIAQKGGTDYTGASTCQLTINRSLSIQSQAGNKFKIRRTVADGAVAYNLKSLFGIRGNGTGTGNEHVTSNTVAVELKNIIIDGGAEWGASTLAQRYTNTTTGAYVRAGRSIIDVYLGAMLNLEDGAEIQNGLCTNSGSTYNDGQGTWNYGAAVRVDYTHDYGGGTVNIKAGAKIHDCSTSYIRSYMNDSDVSVGIGGALGAYNYAYLNIYGGSIYNCSSRRGGAIGCRYRGASGYTQTTAGVVKMYGGSVYNCESVEGGAFCLIGQSANYLLGGSITNCTATNGGAVSIPEGNGPTLNLVAKSYGFLTISDCTNTNETSIASPLDYKYIYKKVGTISETPVYQVTFRSDGADFAVLSVVQGLSLGEAFPASPVKAGYTFDGWFDESDVEYTASSIYSSAKTLTAKWTKNTQTLAESDNNTTWITGHAGQVYDITLTRTLQTGGWNTFSVPFNISSSVLTAKGMTVKELTDASYNDVTKTLSLTFGDAESIEAGKPYLMQVAANVVNPTFNDVTIANDPTPTAITGVLEFVPAINPTALTLNDKSTLFVSGGNTLTWANSGSTMNGFRAYFHILDGSIANARAFVMNFGDETGIESLTPAPSPKGEGSIYSLDGRKLNGQPTQKGLYIVNGKKVIK